MFKEKWCIKDLIKDIRKRNLNYFLEYDDAPDIAIKEYQEQMERLKHDWILYSGRPKKKILKKINEYSLGIYKTKFI